MLTAQKDPTCPKCWEANALRLHATLPEADGLPEVQCFECRTCGEVIVVERELRRETLTTHIVQPQAA